MDEQTIGMGMMIIIILALIAKGKMENRRTQGLNPYRRCCLNCIDFEDGYCQRIKGVQVHKDKPRHQNRCGYFRNINM